MSLLVLTDRTLRAAGLDFDTARALMAPGQDELVIHVAQLLDGQPIPPLEPQATVPSVPQVDHQGHVQPVLVHGSTPGETAFPLPVIDGRAVDSQSVYTPSPGSREVGGVEAQQVVDHVRLVGVEHQGQGTGRPDVAGQQSPKAPPEPPDIALPAGTARLKPGGAGGHDQDLAGQADVASRGGPEVRQRQAGGPDRTLHDVQAHRPPRLPEGPGLTFSQLADAAESVRMSARMAVSGSGIVLYDPLGGPVAYPDMQSAARVIRARQDYANLGYVRSPVEP